MIKATAFHRPARALCAGGARLTQAETQLRITLLLQRNPEDCRRQVAENAVCVHAWVTVRPEG